ncbi:forkhead-associated (FHA) domain-containing protein [Gottschalkia acidurici 9a]|uniref:Forkhead-associated (FHA) domain-containing protein n=1 Tax=Gottschalkia acidurici (strain ATCC 7906 / DSM 604 / BCRC 14475 / CIP 104303 / KCTC 5404 / NCIMB 10678 / 9a) TaxID=1128398 RepID=K0AZ57_GOTA9|nr:FHA domain-containing protein [Gottschalkia acidurici]AFS77975.1 forkhead-associated (FHA) domain-containing protein [Gottschalkia acidurici 9a]
MFNVLSLIFRYVFILLIYLFMLGIIRLIYLDIKSMYSLEGDGTSYLKLINRKETIPYKVKEEYVLCQEVSIGRGNQNDIVLRDPYISKEHARIILDENEYFLEDLNSANGTYLNNEKVLDVIRLKNGDRIKLGQIEFLFVYRD